MTRALVALGANLGPRRDTLRAAIAALAHLPGTQLLLTSALRETEPEDCAPGAPRFVNGACLLETELTPRELLAELLEIERRHGRRREGRRNEPRPLDLDLVLHGEAVVQDPDLVVPHPRAHQRLFVLEPAAELAPDMHHPVLGRSLAALHDALRAAGGSRGAEAAG
ncbi:MAG: 2-amino-4-hydroxy-6-hydroxymethyldihydropteridine diphosphokinase [Planctomycetota bacterium]|jgi:2-amino-4-hydroxy-6-hydroxymethyldihydropteridine diphosphokinase